MNRIFILFTFFLLALLGCKKEDSQPQKAFTFDGTWSKKIIRMDTLGTWHPQSERVVVKLYGDSIEEYDSIASTPYLWGTYKFDNTDTTISPANYYNLIQPFTGKKLRFYFTQGQTRWTDGKPMIYQLVTWNDMVVQISSPDSIFGYSTCCNYYFSMIRN